LFNAALAEADGAPTGEAIQQKKKKAPKKAEQDEAASAEEAAAEAPAESADAASE
ncbi:30S ribosomal protein S16, partial [Mycobacteroides abscessus subsp. abscessus]